MKGNTAKVTDFGMARLLSTFKSYDLTKCPGAAVYMPPEALCDPPDYDLKIDIFLWRSYDSDPDKKVS